MAIDFVPTNATHLRSTCGRFRVWTGEKNAQPDETVWFAADTQRGRRLQNLTYQGAIGACEAWAAPRVPQTLTVTDAPREFDYTGFGTFEVEVLGQTTTGRTLRLVSTPDGFYTENQRMRYVSGLYMAMPRAEFLKIASLVMAVAK